MLFFRQRTKADLLLHCSNCRNSVNPLVSQLTDGARWSGEGRAPFRVGTPQGGRTLYYLKDLDLICIASCMSSRDNGRKSQLQQEEHVQCGASPHSRWFVFSQKLFLPIGLYSSCSISPKARGSCQKCSTGRGIRLATGLG